MIVALVLCDGGRRVWARTEEADLQPLDRVALREGNAAAEGVALIAPSQLLGAVPPPTAVITSRTGHADRADDLTTLPGADLPPLLSHVRTGSIEGQVVQLEPAERRVQVDAGGESLSVSACEVTLLDE